MQILSKKPLFIMILNIRTRAVILRILLQMFHDKRTLALMIIAPCLILTILYSVLDETTHEAKVAIINAPESFVTNLLDYNIVTYNYDENRARIALERGEVDATLNIINGKSYIQIDGSDSDKAQMILNGLEMARLNNNQPRPDLISDVKYIYGYQDMSIFDRIGSILIGFLIFFFVFLVAGISFLQERTAGTLEKLLSTPIRRWEIVVGYVFGFGVITVVQSLVISFYVVHVLNVMNIGSLLYVLIITFFTAMVALTLGILLSTAANNEFQMVQFIPIVVVPQVFFTGLFELSPIWKSVGKIMPLYYTAHALEEVMTRGHGILDIYKDLLIMMSLSVFFMILNIFLLKRYRRI